MDPAPPKASTPSRSRLSLLVGLLATVIVLALNASGSLRWLEGLLLDYRFQLFAFFTPPPSDKVVHIDIDDASLSSLAPRLGRWPWHRGDLARVVDELHDAGAAVIAFDVLFPEGQSVRYEPPETEGEPPIEIHDDAIFAEAIERAGNVMLALSLRFKEGEDALFGRVMALYRKDLEKTVEQVATELKLDEEERGRVRGEERNLKAAAARDLLRELAASGKRGLTPFSLERAREALLPRLEPHVEDSPELSIVTEELEHVRAEAALATRLVTDDDRTRFAETGSSTLPITPLAVAAAGTGFVTFDYDADGVVRSVPLWLHDGRRLYPHFALAIAGRYLGVDPSNMKVTADETVLPRTNVHSGPARDTHIPTLRRRPGDGWPSPAGNVVIPWPSNARDWPMLFDPRADEPTQHIPIRMVLNAPLTRQTAARNEYQADVALLAFAENDPEEFDEELLVELHEARVAVDETDAEENRVRLHEARAAMVARFEALIAAYGEEKEPTEELRLHLEGLTAALDLHRGALRDSQAAAREAAELSAELREKLHGKVCLIGWTGTGTLADFVPTSLEAKVPGVIIHGAIINAILTDHFLTRLNPWADAGLVLSVGLLATLLAAALAPVAALALTLFLICGYFALNGLLLFDYLDVWAAAAGPCVAAAVSWGGVTVVRLVFEQKQRAQITRRFKNYVSPDVVDYLQANPHMVKLEGDSRELTCIFTDIEGFTSLSEKLGPERTVALLNKVLAAATEQLMQHRATVNKFLGDGIMAFWGAPIANPRHALDACQSILACIQALHALGGDPTLEGVPRLHMRVGACTGTMMVGDFGAPPHRSDYTVLGDAVNFAARLESANKQFGTQVLISGRTQELVADVMLTRPIGKLIVVGQHKPQPVHELLGAKADATQKQIEFAEATREAVEAYQHADFQRCMDLVTVHARRFGHSPLTQIYIDACRKYVQWNAPVPPNFDGSITLSAK